MGSASKSYDIFNLTDEALSQKLRFVQECGFGNWGSVWLCQPRAKPSSPDGFDRIHQNKLAVKLVHRRPDVEKSKTTAARVKSLWNEMKIVGSFKSDPHPAIIPFYSFIVTPSYAMITMPYHPALIPVEVDEAQARVWFRFLLSGIEFLHKRGVVHNDIKPANILLSYKNIPVLVDFGFAERYDQNSTTAFHSNLSYGTPEYLSPERARGLPHDTRKSDIWSLGITFFEILIGRTPFEESDKDEFLSQDDLEKYWSRTLRGKWMGSWKMSKSAERLLRRMIAPNADLRCTASEAISDPFWSNSKETDASHRRSASFASSIVFEKDMAKLLDASLPWNQSASGKENLSIPPGLGSPKDVDNRHTISRVKSQPKVTASKSSSQKVKRGPAPQLGNLPPIMASPPTSPNVSRRTDDSKARRPLGQMQPLGQVQPRNQQILPTKPSLEKRKSRVLADLSGATGPKKVKGKENTANQRVREWEREKQRLREMQRLEELERERDEELREKQEADDLEKSLIALAQAAETAADMLSTIEQSTPEVYVSSELQSSQSTSMVSLKHAIRSSIDKTVKKCTSTIGTAGGKDFAPQHLSIEVGDDAESRRSHSERESWEDDALVREAKSSLPVIRHAIHNERMAADNQINRMSIWMRNVEKVVEDARQTFASTSKQSPLPPLPLAPLSRSGSQGRGNRSSRLPRKVLAANQIFVDEPEHSPADQTMSSFVTSIYATPATDASVGAAGKQVIPEIRTPSKQRRATVSAGSCEPTGMAEEMETDPLSKSRSHGNLLQLRIKPLSTLELDLEKNGLSSTPSPRLSAVVDRSLFIAPPAGQGEDADSSVRISKSFDELTASPQIVEPYPARQAGTAIPDTPNRIRLEGVYDRFLMATSGVKRVGKGYQSDNRGPVHNTISHAGHKNNNPRAFTSVRRPMPPPVSSDDQRQTLAVDELGVMTSTPAFGSPLMKDEANTTVTMMRRAIKAIVPGKAVSRRLSRLA